MDEHLIPFKLRPASDISFPPHRSARRSQKRRISAPIPLSLSTNNLNLKPTSSMNLKRLSKKPVVPVKHPKRVSCMPKVYPLFQAKTTLTPYTKQEWASAVKEVKRLYFKEHYKLCAEKCINILENPRGLMHHLHSLFFAFYAATSLELQALDDANSATRLALFKHAKAYYDIAASYMSCAEVASNLSLPLPPLPPPPTRESRGHSCSSSISSACSEADSLFSHLSPGTSPGSSVCDSDGLEKEVQQPKKEKKYVKPRPLTLQARKKVSFQPRLSTVLSVGTVDSTPEVGEYFFRPKAGVNECEERMRVQSPLSLSSPSGPPPTFPLPALPPKSPMRNHRRATSSPQLGINEIKYSEIADMQAAIRYHSNLLTFKPQLSYHLGAISNFVHEGPEISEVVVSDDSSSEYSTDTSSVDICPGLHQAKSKRRKSRKVQRRSGTSFLDLDDDSDSSSDDDESDFIAESEIESVYEDLNRRKNFMTLKEKRARIEEGRKRDWVRVKFDASKYERLCERALMELQH